ncbi:MAG: hypothetical protein JWQ04_644, partial [Pedosphaera sp.]|nr:hypothetical protein [Pedosphaera sp.]
MSERLASLDELKRGITPDKIAYVVQLSPRRIGVLAFATFLEYRHFPPAPVNDDFQIAIIDWEGMRFGLACIPRSKEPLAIGVMQELGLRAADGAPTMLSNKGVTQFPINLPNVFNIEHVPGHFVYRNDPSQ